jgi:tetratricopeptide (TPR) repeat protein
MSQQPATQIVPEFRETLLTQLSTNLLSSRNYNEVLAVLQSPLAKHAGLTASMHFNLGLALLELRQFPEAADQFQLCLSRRDRPALSPVLAEVRKAGPRHCLALCQQRLNRPEAAAKSFEEALGEDATSRPLRFDYASFLAKQNRPVEALQLLQGMISGTQDDLAVWIGGARIGLHFAALNEFVAEWTGEAIKFFPDEELVRLFRAEALLYNQRLEESLAIWRQMPALGPRHQAAQLLCEILVGHGEVKIAVPSEAVEREFLKLYRALVERGASNAIHQLHAKIDEIKTVLPGAAKILEQVMLEAGKGAMA